MKSSNRYSDSTSSQRHVLMDAILDPIEDQTKVKNSFSLGCKLDEGLQGWASSISYGMFGQDNIPTSLRPLILQSDPLKSPNGGYSANFELNRLLNDKEKEQLSDFSASITENKENKTTTFLIEQIFDSEFRQSELDSDFLNITFQMKKNFKHLENPELAEKALKRGFLFQTQSEVNKNAWIELKSVVAGQSISQEAMSLSDWLLPLNNSKISLEVRQTRYKNYIAALFGNNETFYKILITILSSMVQELDLINISDFGASLIDLLIKRKCSKIQVIEKRGNNFMNLELSGELHRVLPLMNFQGMKTAVVHDKQGQQGQAQDQDPSSTTGNMMKKKTFTSSNVPDPQNQEATTTGAVPPPPEQPKELYV